MSFLRHRLKTASLNELIAAAQASDLDDTTPMDEIVRRFDSHAKGVARSMTSCPHLQEDLANAARIGLVRAVRNHDLRRHGFPAYAARFMRGAAFRELRRWTDNATLDVSLDAVAEIAAQTDAEDRVEVIVDRLAPWGDGAVARVVDGIAPDQRAIVELRYVKDAPLREIAAATGTTCSAVSQRLSTVHRVVVRALAA